MHINDKDYEEISSTAIVTSYPRIFTDIPYEKEIYEWLSNYCNEEVTLNKMTSRNNLNDRFENIEHIKDFFGKIGFEVIEIHKFSEMIKDLYSVKHYGIINTDIEQSLEAAIVAVMKVKDE